MKEDEDPVKLPELQMDPTLLPLSPLDLPTLVLDLDETLIHTSQEEIQNYDIMQQLNIDDQLRTFYIRKRPFLDRFLDEMSKLYEIVVFTASCKEYALPIIDLIDSNKAIKYKLHRDHCDIYHGNYIKDLSRLGRRLNKTVMIDNAQISCIFQPRNAITIQSFFDNTRDKELLKLIPILQKLTKCNDFTQEITKVQQSQLTTQISFPSKAARKVTVNN